MIDWPLSVLGCLNRGIEFESTSMILWCFWCLWVLDSKHIANISLLIYYNGPIRFSIVTPLADYSIWWGLVISHDFKWLCTSRFNIHPKRDIVASKLSCRTQNSGTTFHPHSYCCYDMPWINSKGWNFNVKPDVHILPRNLAWLWPPKTPCNPSARFQSWPIFELLFFSLKQVFSKLPSDKLTLAGWNIPIFNRKNIFNPGPFSSLLC